MMMIVVPMLVLAADPTVVVVDRDNVAITESCSVTIADQPIVDADGNGVIQITGKGITVDFGGARLRGAAPDQTPDTFSGLGVHVAGPDITIRNLNVSGYKVGIRAVTADNLVVEDCDLSGNFRQRLRSTPQAEDPSDWLWPHANDEHEWMTNYGAALYVERSKLPTIRRIKVREGQNGIILDRVEYGQVYDNDCSFLSGWGLAMWRSNKCLISRNAFDFCIRGYSHGVYNRGQDSAGILMFEQCSNNIIAANSVTHGGDGIFGFAGKEALGETSPEGVIFANDQERAAWCKGRGCNENVIIENDLSFAAAHGVEMTFSFDNKFVRNRMAGNGICGLWGGYSRKALISENRFERNGDMGYGDERGGINIEHGRDITIRGNEFADNPCGIFLWWDADEALAGTPWGQANGVDSAKYLIEHNTFENDAIALQVRASSEIEFKSNGLEGVKKDLDVDSPESVVMKSGAAKPNKFKWLPMYVAQMAKGDSHPVAAHPKLAGRDKIIMTEWGPYDWERPLLLKVKRFDHADHYRIVGTKSPVDPSCIHVDGEVHLDVDQNDIAVRPTKADALIPYHLSLDVDGESVGASGALTGGTWRIHVFSYQTDPRENVEKWRREAGDSPHVFDVDELDLRFGMDGPSQACKLPGELPRDRFGTIATQSLTIPAGQWRIRTTSDDGIRVWMNNELVIDDWTWHAPRQHVHEFTLDEPTKIDFRVEHFELDGYAILAFDVERVAP